MNCKVSLLLAGTFTESKDIFVSSRNIRWTDNINMMIAVLIICLCYVIIFSIINRNYDKILYLHISEEFQR